MRSTSDGVMRDASSTARQRIGQGELALSNSQTGYGQPAGGVRMEYCTNRDVIGTLRLTLDTDIFSTGAVLSWPVGALSAAVSSAGSGTADIIT